jgi:hypothetical protein
MMVPTLIITGDEDDACIQPSLFLKHHSGVRFRDVCQDRPHPQSRGARFVQRDAGAFPGVGRGEPLAAAQSCFQAGVKAERQHGRSAVPGVCLEPCGARRFDDARVLKKTGYQDRSKINMHEPHEVQCWTKPLGVSKEELQKAVCGEARNDHLATPWWWTAKSSPKWRAKATAPAFRPCWGRFFVQSLREIADTHTAAVMVFRIQDSFCFRPSSRARVVIKSRNRARSA